MRVFSCIVAIAFALSCPAHADKQQPTQVNEQPKVEVVFVLDTTGSMSGLIAAAKDKIWAIANTLATTKPTPYIKLGLIGYRDRRDAYITKRFDLSDDLDAIYKELMAFQAGGGGDTPESVNQGLHEAVADISWSKDPKTYQVIFLVGDCPPHMDYKDDVKYPETCQQAAKAGLIINTIQCGSNGGTEPVWRDIAKRAEGNYFRVEQSGGAILPTTPFDKKLAELAKDLDTTRVYYGTQKEIKTRLKKDEVAKEIYSKASVESQARRSVFNGSAAGAWNFAGNNELINDIVNGKVKLDKIKKEKLPENLQKMSAKEQKEFCEAKLKKRQDIQKQIHALDAKRQKHLEDLVAKTKEDPKLDNGIFKSIQGQAAKKGIKYNKISR